MTEHFNHHRKLIIESIISNADLVSLKDIIKSILNDEYIDLTDLIYHIAIGSNLCGKLELEFSKTENCYFVHPIKFFNWCIHKKFHEDKLSYNDGNKVKLQISDFLTAYYIFEHCIQSNPEEQSGKSRKPYASAVDRHCIKRIVEAKIRENPEIKLETLLKDSVIKDISKSYTPETVTGWIRDDYPQFKRRRGRPPKLIPIS